MRITCCQNNLLFRRHSLLIIALFVALTLTAQESCYEQYLREHNMPFLTAEDADDSYEELKKEVLARQAMRKETLFQPLMLAVDTISGACHLLSQDGSLIADVHLALVDSTWYMWLSVDPLADKNIFSTPYIYCSGNPIMFVDPDGRNDYVVNSDGDIQKVKDTDDKFDRLSTLGIDGSFNEDNAVEIKDQTLLSGLISNSEMYKNQFGKEHTMNFVVGKYGREAAKLFLYVAKNTNVEWSFTAFFSGGYRRYGISTSHNEEGALAAYKATILNVSERCVIFSIHSHWREDSEKGASSVQGGDIKSLSDMNRRFVIYGQRIPPHYVYHVKSGGLFNYTLMNPSIFIRNLNLFPDYTGLDFLIP